MRRNVHLDVLFVLDHILRDFEPQLLAQLVVIFGHVCVDLCEFQVALLEREIDAVLPQAHLGVDVHAWLCPSSLLAQP